VGRALGLAAAIRELVITTDPLVGELLLREGGDSPLFRWWRGVGVATGVRISLFVAQSDCEESVTVYWQKDVVGECDYRRRAEYVLRQTAARRQKMDGR
jgi:hypothetical protein